MSRFIKGLRGRVIRHTISFTPEADEKLPREPGKRSDYVDRAVKAYQPPLPPGPERVPDGR